MEIVFQKVKTVEIPQSLLLSRCRIGRAERGLPNLSARPATSAWFHDSAWQTALAHAVPRLTKEGERTTFEACLA